jgi:SAM-dependent methyltransferase
MSEHYKPSPEEQEANIIKRWDERHEKGWTESKDGPEPRFLEFIEKHKDEIGPRILDIGSGGGRHLIPLRQMGYEVTGLEISPKGLKENKYRLEETGLAEDGQGINLVRGSFKRLPFNNESFDTAMSIQVLHNNDWPGAVQAFKEAARVLKPGGLFFIRVRSVMNKPKEGEVIVDDERGRTWITAEPGEGGATETMHDFTLEELQDLAKENDLEIIDEPVDERYRPDGATEPGQWNVTFRKYTKL